MLGLVACEWNALRWEHAGEGIFNDSEVVRKTLEHAFKRGLVSEDDSRGPKINLKTRPKYHH